MVARIVAVALALAVFAGSARAQSQESPPAYVVASPEYEAAQTRVRRGKALVVVGGLMAGAGGLAMLAGYQERQSCEADGSSGLFECLGGGAVQAAGGVLAAGGVVSAAAGGLLWLHGDRTLDDLAAAPVAVTPRRGGATVALTLSF